jgi:hypothetical protein
MTACLVLTYTDNRPLEFIDVIYTNEKLVIKSLTYPYINYYRSYIEPELPKEVLDLLERYLQLALALVPPLRTDDIHSLTL